MTPQEIRETKEWARRSVRPIIRQSPALEWSGKTKNSPHKRAKNTDGEPPDHGRRMGSRQVLDTYETKARARPRHHQPVPSQYRAW